MFNFLHTFNPDPVLLSLGPIKIYWYGLLVVSGILGAIFITIKIAEYFKQDKEMIINLIFWLIIGGVLGARAYHIFLEWNYYSANPKEILAFWHGGLAIHGGILAGLGIIWFYARKYKLFASRIRDYECGTCELPMSKFLSNKLNFLFLSSLLAPGLALAQTIGRFGNYFNQEIFGRPTDLPWGIPIKYINRPAEYFNFQYFHPTFLYESIGNFLIFLFLFIFYKLQAKRGGEINKGIFFYLILYSILRFFLEFLRVDKTYVIGVWRWPQIVSIAIIIISLIFLLPKRKKHANV